MKKLSVILALSGVVAVCGIQQAQAQAITLTFGVTVSSGDWAGETGYGSFTYASFFPDTWVVPPNLSVTLHILGQDFTQADDALAPLLPAVQLVGGDPVFLLFGIADAKPSDPNVINEPGVQAISIVAPLIRAQSGPYDYQVQANVIGTKVPEPSSVAFSMVALLGLGTFIVRRRRAKKG
jgi:hypothetical protein